MINIQDIRDTARDMLAKGEARMVIGYRRGTRGMLAEPAFITDPAQADDLVWDPTCFNNLSLYLVHDKKFLAHMRENPKGPLAVQQRRSAAAFDGDDFVFTTAAGEKRLAAREVMADRCLECRAPYPKEHNLVFGEDKTGRQLEAPFAALERFEAQDAGQRWDAWSQHFDRCMRCFACRSVCPMCYCDECVVDSITFPVTAGTTAEEKATRIKWIERSATRSENITYLMTRAMHLAGRCTDCGECERACPVNVPIRMLNNKMEREAREKFGFEPGASIGGPSLVATFLDSDPGQFIR
ncbi:MAG: hypothetical protein A3F73_07320 [Gallionellales bacterium RIFCSPLOWO2_12_FULL_59_22]|nr:MAG: hypothetical protein A3F73_07320 [Gallionellales bacterium RIFCSPLOWO2_12_FULL_59_22]